MYNVVERHLPDVGVGMRCTCMVEVAAGNVTVESMASLLEVRQQLSFLGQAHATNHL
jgi:hypothetical protein